MMTMYDVPDFDLDPPEPHSDECYCAQCHEFHRLEDWSVLPECPRCLDELEGWSDEIARDIEIDKASEENERDMDASLEVDDDD